VTDALLFRAALYTDETMEHVCEMLGLIWRVLRADLPEGESLSETRDRVAVILS
jgi:hypothetical protein